MAPPKRPSTMRKVSSPLSLRPLNQGTPLIQVQETLTKFPHGYSHAPPPAAHHANSMFKSTVSAQHQMQHSQRQVPAHPSQTVQMSNARIPFAENANPPAQQHYAQHTQQYAGHENMAPGTAQSKFKTPARPAQNPKSAKNTPTSIASPPTLPKSISTTSSIERSTTSSTSSPHGSRAGNHRPQP